MRMWAAGVLATPDRLGCRILLMAMGVLAVDGHLGYGAPPLATKYLVGRVLLVTGAAAGSAIGVEYVA